MQRILTGGVVALAGLLLAGSGMAQEAGRAPSSRTAPDRVQRGRSPFMPPRAAACLARSRTPACPSRYLRGTATQLGRQAQALLGFLRTQDAERLRTEGTSSEPEIRNQPDRIKGYTGRISVSFRTVPDQLPSCWPAAWTTVPQP